MIRLTRMNGTEVVVNADLIEFVEMTPDTLITLLTGKKIPVRESSDEVMARVISYRRAIGTAHASEAFRGTSRSVEGDA